MQKNESPEASRKALNKIVSDLTRSILLKDELTRFWFFILIMFAGVGIWGWILQVKNGLGVTGMGDYVSWGLYIANFVFFVAVSLVGLLISSVLQLLKISWAKPVSRAAEQIAIAAVALAGIIIVMDMGRPDRLHHVFIFGRFASPILWDLTVVSTYLAISLLLFYIPLIPDLAILHKKMGPELPNWKRKLYKALSLGWKGNEQQFRTVYHALRVLMILIIPVGLSIHTVTSWLFAATLRPGWDSTIFGPYFVVGAFVAGTAALIILMYVYRLRYGLRAYYTDLHFDRMGKLLVLVCLVYLYFNINEFFVPVYKMKLAEGVHLKTLFSGGYAFWFWFAQVVGLVLPILLIQLKFFRKPLPLALVSAVILVSAWVKRYLIVIPTMEHPFLPVQNVPESFQHYAPTSTEIMIMLFSFFASLLIISILAKLFPVISIWEVAEEQGIEIDYLAEETNSQ
jgi:molybdopterin-containing oxidoreductase family membrane subunit